MTINQENYTNRFIALYNTPEGQALWEFLNTPECVSRLKAASDMNRPAVEGVDFELALSFPHLLVGPIEKTRGWKQLTGMFVRDILEAEGYVRLPKKQMPKGGKTTSGRIFRTGTVYIRLQGVSMYQHTCGQLFELQHKQSNTGSGIQIVIHYSPQGKPGVVIPIVGGRCPDCGELLDQRSLLPLKTRDEEDESGETGGIYES